MYVHSWAQHTYSSSPYCPSVAETGSHLVGFPIGGGVVDADRVFLVFLTSVFISSWTGWGSEEWQAGATAWRCWGRLMYVSSSLLANKCGCSFFLQWLLLCTQKHLVLFQTWLILELEYGFTWIFFSGFSFKWKTLPDFSRGIGLITFSYVGGIRVRWAERVGLVTFSYVGSTMVRWAEIRVWHKKRPGRRNETWSGETREGFASFPNTR